MSLQITYVNNILLLLYRSVENRSHALHRSSSQKTTALPLSPASLPTPLPPCPSSAMFYVFIVLMYSVFTDVSLIISSTSTLVKERKIYNSTGVLAWAKSDEWFQGTMLSLSPIVWSLLASPHRENTCLFQDVYLRKSNFLFSSVACTFGLSKILPNSKVYIYDYDFFF